MPSIEMKVPRLRRIAACSLAVVLGGVLCGSALYGYWALVEHRLATVTEGEVYRSGAMPPQKLVETVRARGIRAVVDLRSEGPDVAAERAALAEAGVKYFHVPSSQVPKPEMVDAFLEVAAQPENRPLLIHCTHGIGRAPLYSAIYRMEMEGWPNEKARRAAYWGSGMGSFNPDDRKGEFILEYEPRLAGDGSAAVDG